ncbi:MAG: GntR family transcriptional regulator [Reyranellaceae bacterium]
MHDALQTYLSRAAPGGPKHAQLRAALEQAIDDGLWRDGSRLPTEQELTGLVPFSLGTVQRALRSLVEEGRLERTKGRGTFVSEQRRGIAEPFLHVRFLDESGTRPLPIFPKVLSKRRIAERGPWSALLGQRGDNILRIERLIRVGDEFDVFGAFYINAERYPAFAGKSVRALAAGNFKLMLARDYNLPPLVYRNVLEIAAFPAAVSRALGLKAGTVGGIVRLVAHAGAQPLYYQDLFVPPNRRQMQLPEIVLPTGR